MEEGAGAWCCRWGVQPVLTLFSARIRRMVLESDFGMQTTADLVSERDGEGGWKGTRRLVLASVAAT